MKTEIFIHKGILLFSSNENCTWNERENLQLHGLVSHMEADGMQ